MNEIVDLLFDYEGVVFTATVSGGAMTYCLTSADHQGDGVIEDPDNFHAELSSAAETMRKVLEQ